MKQRILEPKVWGLQISNQGELMVGGCSTVSLAKTYGTPLHVVNESRLETTAYDFLEIFNKTYPGKVTIHYAFKCNSVPGIVKILKRAGLKAEVMSEYEFNLAIRLGYKGEDIIINGPYKPDSFLRLCVENKVRFIIIDSLAELKSLQKIGDDLGKEIDILLRINPDYVPRGMNQGSATGSRKGCAFGLDLRSEEVDRALDELKGLTKLHCAGFHFHIGTGIRYPDDFSQALQRLKKLVDRSLGQGFRVLVFDIGGGFATMTSREMTTREMLLYQGWERLPVAMKSQASFTFQNFASAVTNGLHYLFPEDKLPELLVEPGRCITSSNQFLLLTVHGVKERKGVKKWIITDGGIGTVCMPTFYEYHELFLCNDVKRPRTQNVTIIGPVCFASDVVYRNKRMPEVNPGEVLAIMDSGAYFTAWESSFGFPRPAIITVSNGKHRLIRHREIFDDMIARDDFIG